MKMVNVLCNTAIVVLFALPASAQVCSVSPLKSFDASSNGNTQPSSINNNGEIAGILVQSGPVYERGFVRAPNGQITLFDASRAVETSVQHINARGVIAGFYVPGENHNEQNGFVRDESGNITPFGVPGYYSTLPLGINGKGEIVGTTVKSPGALGGAAFFRAEDGQITAFSVPGTTDSTQKVATNINDEDTITGYIYNGRDQTAHGFVRAADGTVTGFDPDSTSPVYTTPFGINNLGQISGSYLVMTSQGFISHGFVRDVNGAITTIDPTGSTSTTVAAINNLGFTVGSYTDANDRYHAFVRNPSGGITSFSAPNATDTVASVINDVGEIAGDYWDANSREHGFLAKLTCK
jgi:hypothetical protein